MREKKGILFFGWTEILIGTTTLATIAWAIAYNISQKPINVLIFVILSGSLSAALGTGILLRKRSSRKLLVFFSGWIILSKILIFSDIFALNGALETTLPENIKNLVSIAYHSIVILYFQRKTVKIEFS